MLKEGFYIPGPIYRILPIVYVASGLATIFYLPNVLSVVSGVLLISAGVLVYMWRLSARSEQRRRRRPGARRTKSAASRWSDGDKTMKWQ